MQYNSLLLPLEHFHGRGVSWGLIPAAQALETCVPDLQIRLGLQASDLPPLVLRQYNSLKEGHARCGFLQQEES